MFARKVNIYIIRTGLVGIVNVVVIYFIAHYMGPEPLGLIGYGTAYIGLFFTFTELGFGNAHIKRISEGKDLATCIGTYLTIKVVLVTLLILALIVSLLIKKFYYNSQFDNPEQAKVIYLLLIPLALAQFSSISIRTFEAKKEAIKASIGSIVAPLIKAPFTIFVAITGLGVYGLIFAQYISSIVLFVISTYFLLKYPIKKPNLIYFKSYIQFAYKLFFLTFLAGFSLQLDKIMIGEFISTAAVGLYFSVSSIISFLNVIPDSVGILLFPIFSENHSLGKIENIKRQAYMAEKYITMLLMPATIILAYFSEDFIKLLLGEKFLDAAFAFSLLAFYFLINGMRKPIASVLAGTDRMGTLARMSTISVLANILLNFVLIPDEIYGIKLAGLGISGCAVATLVSGIIYSVLCRQYVHRIYGKYSEKKIYIQYLGGFLMLAFFFLGNKILPVSEYFGLIKILILLIYCILGIVLFFAILAIFKEFTKMDIKMFYDSVRIGMMKDYFKSEIKN